MVHESAPDQLAELKKLLAEKDYDNYTVHIHSLKGQLLNIGNPSLAEAARNLEYAAKEGRYEYLDEHTEVFTERYENLVKQLESAFASM